MGVRLTRLPLPDNFPKMTVTYLASLIEVAPNRHQQQHSLSLVYTHRYRSPQGESPLQPSKNRLKDHLLIDRYDRLLRFVFSQMQEEGLAHLCRMPRNLVCCLEGTYAIAKRYLGEEGAEEYRDNI
jgi:hypothetical protein